jgi:hypothetical protein
MGETSNKSRIAELAFKDIFSVFGWSKTGPYNEEWACVAKHKEATPKLGRHPTDAVYKYVDPYQPTSVFVNIDFKSYAKTTLEKADLAAALRSLANAVDCANKSVEFQERYLGADTGETVGLLFVFNHDNRYDPGRFSDVRTSVPADALDIAKGRRMGIFGPAEIAYLGTVAADILRLQGTDDLRTHERKFVLPNLIDRPARTDSALSMELLLGPWQLVRFSGVRDNRPHSEIHFYYRAAGTLRQFEYIFDFLFRFQLLEDVNSILLRLPDGDDDAAVQLEHAKAAFVSRYYNLKEIAEKLKKVSYVPVSRVQYNYSAMQIGMTNE